MKPRLVNWRQKTAPMLVPMLTLVLVVSAGLAAIKYAPVRAQSLPVSGGTAAPVNPLGHWQASELTTHPLVGKIWSARSKGLVALQPLAKAIALADFALLGEVHDNPDVHRVQAWALGVRARARGTLPVVMEMLNDAQQPVLDELFGKGKGTRSAPKGAGTPSKQEGAAALSAATVLKRLQWNKTGWPDAKIYEPIITAVLSAKGTLYPGSSARGVVRKIGKQGFKSLKKAQIKRLGLESGLPEPLAKDLRRELQEGHCNMLPERAMPAMMKVQRYRDAIMAAALVRARKGVRFGAAGSTDAGATGAGDAGASLIAGNGHVRADRAVPRYLRAMVPGARIVVVAIMEVEAGESDPASYVPRGLNEKAAADFVVFVPRQARKDQCEELRKMFSKIKKNKQKKAKSKTKENQN